MHDVYQPSVASGELADSGQDLKMHKPNPNHMHQLPTQWRLDVVVV
jgi:hypothetical protein